MTLCDNCSKPMTGQYLYSPSKNDDKKFCCDNCFGIYYGYYVENCQECSKKLFRSYQSYCSTCKWKHEAEIRKEEAEKRKKAKELKNLISNWNFIVLKNTELEKYLLKVHKKG